MKQVLLNVHGLFFLFLFALSPSLLSAQVKAADDVVNGGKILDMEEEGRLPANEECMVTFTIRINTINLPIFRSGSFSNSTDDIFPMTVRYSVNGSGDAYLPVSLTDFVPADEIISAYQYYHWTYPVQVSVIEECQQSDPALDIELELMTGDIGEYIPYPTEDYNGPGEIFDCEFFNTDDCVCGSECLSQFSETLSIENCEFCDDRGYTNDHDQPRKTAESNASQKQLSALPNPFQNQLSFNNLPSSDKAWNIRIFTASGHLMYKHQKGAKARLSSLILDTSNWEAGIYFIETFVDGRQQISRLIKLVD